MASPGQVPRGSTRRVIWLSSCLAVVTALGGISISGCGSGKAAEQPARDTVPPPSSTSKSLNRRPSHHAVDRLPQTGAQTQPRKWKGALRMACQHHQRARCIATLKASRSARTGTTETRGRCPATLSREQCAADISAERQARGHSHPQRLRTCPAIWSRSQCEAAEKASWEARR